MLSDVTATIKARRALERGIGFLCLGAAFATPVVGSTAAKVIDLLLAGAGLRYGPIRLT